MIALVRNAFLQDPFLGHLYVFFSKRCDRVRVVYWDRNGFAMWSKRLERGRFHVRFSDSAALHAQPLESAELNLILEGIDLRGARRRARWEPNQAASAVSS